MTGAARVLATFWTGAGAASDLRSRPYLRRSPDVRGRSRRLCDADHSLDGGASCCASACSRPSPESCQDARRSGHGQEEEEGLLLSAESFRVLGTGAWTSCTHCARVSVRPCFSRELRQDARGALKHRFCTEWCASWDGAAGLP